MIIDKLLITTDYIKDNTSISDNLNDEFLIPVIKDCQLSHLQPLIGTNLYDKLCSESLTEDYQYLLDNYVSQFLLFAVQSELCVNNYMKQHNAGAVSYVDTNYDNKNLSELKYLKAYYSEKETFYGKRLVEYLHAHHGKYPEFCTTRDCSDMHATDSLYHCGLNISKAALKKRRDK